MLQFRSGLCVSIEQRQQLVDEVLGKRIMCEALHGEPIHHENLHKVVSNLGTPGLPLEELVQWISIRPIHLHLWTRQVKKAQNSSDHSEWQRDKVKVTNLSEYWKVKAVIVTKSLYLIVGSRFFLIELVRWESQDFQSTFLQVVIHFPQPAEVPARLWGLGRNVN